MVTQTTSLADPTVKKAIHAPDQVWNQSVYYLFGGGPDDDPSEWPHDLPKGPTNAQFRSRVRSADRTYPVMNAKT